MPEISAKMEDAWYNFCTQLFPFVLIYQARRDYGFSYLWLWKTWFKSRAKSWESSRLFEHNKTYDFFYECTGRVLEEGQSHKTI